MRRSSGVLMHISSLPSPHGIGTFGDAAYRFVDFLASAAQKYWQILPLSPTGYGDSPYQALSSGAGNPYFVDLDLLCAQGLLEKSSVEAINWGERDDCCDYGALFEHRIDVLRPACAGVEERFASELSEFCTENSDWLGDYALFMALKYKFDQQPWYLWPEEYKRRFPNALTAAAAELCEDVRLFKAIQFLFCRQWSELKGYANRRGVKIIGDIPIYVPYDSADVWANLHCFRLDETLTPVAVSGCPPDGFSEDGQLWGTPVYDWEALRADGYGWWLKRVRRQFELYDVLRIDHFRGFDAYYAIPYGAENGRVGVWERGPGIDFFNVLRQRLGNLPIIAEDLGFLTPTVRQLLADSGYPGMKVLQFAFDSREDSDYLPHNYPRNCVAYIGTHDNDTAKGWFSSAPADDVAMASDYLRIHEGEDRVKAMICALLGSEADLAVITMQDLLSLDSGARMNVPGTLGGNWLWRMSAKTDLSETAKWLKSKTKLYGRI